MFSKKIKVTCNKKPEKGRRRPMFWDEFEKAAAGSEFKISYNLKKKTDLVMVFVGAESRLDVIKQRQEEGAKVVQRVDGLWGWEHGDIKGDPRNKPIIDVYQIADAVIFQSEFNKQVFETFVEPARPVKPAGPDTKKYIVINGADPAAFSPDGDKHDKFGFKRMIVTAALWREWKGLQNVIDVFEYMDDPDSVLIVIGDGCDTIDHPRIKFVGHQTHSDMARYFRSADAFVYLPWFDWCPNTVVQAVLCGSPIVCTSRGGTKEIVAQSGIVVRSQPEGEIKKYYEPAGVDLDQAAAAVTKVLANRGNYLHERSDLHIKTCVDKYLEVFRQTLR